jgi:hypothetical protein
MALFPSGGRVAARNGIAASVQQTHTLCHFVYSTLPAAQPRRNFKLTQSVQIFRVVRLKNLGLAKNSSDHLPSCGPGPKRRALLTIVNARRAPPQ